MYNLTPVTDVEFYPLFEANPAPPEKAWYKIYSDGGHYIAQPVLKNNKKVKRSSHKRDDVDIAFDSLYRSAKSVGLKDFNLRKTLNAQLTALFPYHPDMGEYVVKKIDNAKRNFWKREKRFRRKAYLNKWNFFVTFTYDDKKQNEETFRKKLRRCLSNLHTRRGWRYMGVFERAPDTGRLHFHGVFYVPEGEMLGVLTQKTDYSAKMKRLQLRDENSFFEKKFGRNDFEALSDAAIKRGQALKYILKYLDKTGERIVYSRGISTEICKEVSANDIVTELKGDFCRKYILFDDVISWDRDVMLFEPKQISLIDLICNFSPTIISA